MGARIIKRANGSVDSVRTTPSPAKSEGRFFRPAMTKLFQREREKEGLSYRAIARRHGCRVFTSYYVANPEAYARWKARKSTSGRR